VKGKLMEHDAVEQAKSQAYWIREVLQESTGKSFPVKPVVVFPGWYVERAKGKDTNAPMGTQPQGVAQFHR
jgi:hypothetical protein